MASHAEATTSPSSISEGGSTNEQKQDSSPSSDNVMGADPNRAITGRDPNSKIVGWNGPDDPDNPKNWPNRRKWMITVSLGMLTWVVTFASSIFSTATRPAAKEFGVSIEVMTLGTSLFVLVRSLSLATSLTLRLVANPPLGFRLWSPDIWARVRGIRP
jgi:hypothetical protein